MKKFKSVVGISHASEVDEIPPQLDGYFSGYFIEIEDSDNRLFLLIKKTAKMPLHT